jgi:deoxyribodipyrimidine photo-lyase
MWNMCGTGLLGGEQGNVVLTMTEVTSEEVRIDRQVRDAVSGKAKLRKEWGHTLYHIEDLPFAEGLSDMEDVFTPFKNKVEKKSSVRKQFATPKQGDLPVPKDIEATSAAEWDKLPLAESVKSEGLPQTHANAVLDFEVRSYLLHFLRSACAWLSVGMSHMQGLMHM